MVEVEIKPGQVWETKHPRRGALYQTTVMWVRREHREVGLLGSRNSRSSFDSLRKNYRLVKDA